MSDINKIAQNLAEIIKSSDDKKTSAYDTPATVTRIDGSTAWVHIPGGVDETPVKLTVNAEQGDTVQVRVAGGRAWITGNASAPPTDDRTANIANSNAQVAYNLAGEAQTAASEAYDAAASAVESANAAGQAATRAETSAAAAEASAVTANLHATNALNGLSEVEKVVDVLTWIAEHGQYALTADEEVQDGKTYFTRSGAGTEADPYVYTPVTNPTGDPSALGYYELTGVDEAVTDFISTHLALLDDGLYITLNNTGYKVKITNTAVYILNDLGEAISTYTNTTTIGNILSNNVYIDEDSVDVRQGTTVVASFGHSTIVGAPTAEQILLENGHMTVQNVGIPVAKFGKESQIGRDGSSHITLTEESTSFYDVYGNISAQINHGQVTTESVEDKGTVYVMDDFPQEWQTNVLYLSKMPTAGSTVTITISSSYGSEELLLPIPQVIGEEGGTVRGQIYGASFSAYAYQWIYEEGEAMPLPRIGFMFIDGHDASCTVSVVYNTNVADPVFLFGKGLISTEPYSFIVGQYNEDNYNLFAVGNGSDDNNRQNVFEIDLNGATVYGELFVSGNTSLQQVSIDSVLGDLTTDYGNLTVSNYDPIITLTNSTTNAKSYIIANEANNLGNNLLIQAGGNFIAGGGEYPTSRHDATVAYDTNEDTYLGADGTVYIESNGQTIANANTWIFATNGNTDFPGQIRIASNNRSLTLLGSDGSTYYDVLRLNASDQLIIGSALYGNNVGTTFLYGNNITIASRNDISLRTSGGTRSWNNTNRVAYSGGAPSNEVTSLATSAWTIVGDFTLTKGTYIVSVKSRVASNANGRRTMVVSNNNTADSSGGVSVSASTHAAPVNGDYTDLVVFFVLNVTADSATYYIKLMQNSGSTLNCNTRVHAVQLY